ncbi:MAG: succinate dehydrogenase cytochrome b subunit, partial [Bacteroidota bacterium]
MGLTNFLKSSLLSKFVMAVTGIILVAYIIGHTLGNLQFYLGPDVINAYASFLRGTGELLWVVRFVLFAAVILHIITSIRLSMLNQSSGGKYNVRQYVKTRIYSRTMLVTGITIAAFVVYHILHFTTGDIDPSNHGLVDHYGPNNLFERHDLYYNMVMSFRQPLISAIY